MATATETTDDGFRIASLVGDSGVGGNGEALLDAVASFYPPSLVAAQERRTNVALTEELDLEDVAKIAGVDRVEDAVVAGGERDSDDAWVRYAAYNSAGDTIKGAFPYPDLGKKTSKLHVSQRDSLEDSAAARDFNRAQEKRDAAPSSSADAPVAADPISAYDSMSAKDVVAYLEANPDRADVIKAIEVATHGDDARTTITDWEPPTPEGSDDGSDDGGGA